MAIKKSMLGNILPMQITANPFSENFLLSPWLHVGIYRFLQTLGAVIYVLLHPGSVFFQWLKLLIQRWKHP